MTVLEKMSSALGEVPRRPGRLFLFHFRKRRIPFHETALTIPQTPLEALALLTVVLLFVDVVGSLFIPTLVAEMLNAGTSGAAFQSIVTTGIQMAVISAVAGLVAIAGDMPAPP